MMDRWIELLGAELSDAKSQALLEDWGIRAVPKLKRGDPTVVVSNAKKGIEITFRDAATLDVDKRADKKGTLVLQNIRMYGDAHDTFSRFSGGLPLGLELAMNRTAVEAALGGEPNWVNPARPHMRW